MDIDDTPLMHFPDLVRSLLRAGMAQPGTLVAAAKLLVADRAKAHEESRVDVAELAANLDRARRHLVAARALEVLDSARFRTTPRGRVLLRSHPDGIDDSVLMDFPEFRDWMARTEAGGIKPEDPRPREFLSGWNAGWEGGDLGDNPFPADTAQHAAWVDGWLEAERHGRE
ncbi:MAG TPA: hypothetical protein VL974_05435 [Magnetospirillum sp.]|jgi:hypothetical protein|nr:hypothetical protein [Magnetospirillum sp.]